MLAGWSDQCFSALRVFGILIVCTTSGCDTNSQNESMQASAQETSPTKDRQFQSAEGPSYNCADIISEQDIDSAFGFSGTRRYFGSRGEEDKEFPGYSECDFELPGGYVVSIGIYAGQSVDNIDLAWDQVKSKGAEPVPGIGDSAFLADFAGGSLILVRSRGQGVRVNTGDMEGHGTLDADKVVKQIAAIVVKRL